ncbi:hypothetical protein Ddc_13383 [Ditylenchus destructor]|nr:hypothetical protein Ddc_13383 [Ditylenchus destructor]
MVFICEILILFAFSALTCGIFEICSAGDTPEEIPTLKKKSVTFSAAHLSLLDLQKKIDGPTKAAEMIAKSKEKTKESAVHRRNKDNAKKLAAEFEKALFEKLAQG